MKNLNSILQNATVLGKSEMSKVVGGKYVCDYLVGMANKHYAQWTAEERTTWENLYISNCS